MKVYVCEPCNFSSKIKTHFERHKNTKKHQGIVENIEKTALLYGLKMTMTQNDPQMTQNDPGQNSKKKKNFLEKYEKKKKLFAENINNIDETIIEDNTEIDEPFLEEKNQEQKKKKNILTIEEKKKNFLEESKKKKTFFCIYCGNGFSTKAHKRRHEIHRCKRSSDVLLKEKEDELNELKHEKKELYKKMNNLLDKVGNTTNIHANIHLNNYGNEDLTHLSNNLLTNMLKIPFEMIPKMIQVVHFNDNKPENKNIFLPNKKDNFVKVFKNNKWIYQDKNEVLKALVTNKYNVMDNHYEIVDQKEVIGDNIKTNYLKFKNYYNQGDKEFIEKLKKECEIILLNNR